MFSLNISNPFSETVRALSLVSSASSVRESSARVRSISRSASAGVFGGLQDILARATEYWRAAVGVGILVIVSLFPYGIGGAAMHLRGRRSWGAHGQR